MGIHPIRFTKKTVLPFFLRYERHISSLALLTGFIVDNLTLTRVDLLFDNLVILTYLCVATLSVLIVNLYEGGKYTHSFFYRLRQFAPIPMQFAFGGLFSGFFVFYSRSAALTSSWLFLLMLFTLLIGNEFFRSRYARLTFQISVLFFAYYSYMIFALPVVFRKIGMSMFLLSGITSLLLITTLLYICRMIAPERINKGKRKLAYSIGSIYVLMHVFYFLNVIPPIPLALKDIGIAHSIARTGDHFLIQEEKDPWYEMFLPYHTIYGKDDESIYVYSSVFAPTRIDARIVHEWQKFNEKDNSWDTLSTIQFPISGGRDLGYRGYTKKNHLTEGWWGVNVETEGGQLLGRLTFTYKEGVSPRGLLEKTW